jgi:hypothetical protein
MGHFLRVVGKTVSIGAFHRARPQVQEKVEGARMNSTVVNLLPGVQDPLL